MYYSCKFVKPILTAVGTQKVNSVDSVNQLNQQ